MNLAQCAAKKVEDKVILYFTPQEKCIDFLKNSTYSATLLFSEAFYHFICISCCVFICKTGRSAIDKKIQLNDSLTGEETTRPSLSANRDAGEREDSRSMRWASS